jgi:alpha-tubulin suppressor-like RCC1 family protein
MWGTNTYGQLGNGNTVSYLSPQQVGSLTNWKQVSCGYYYTTAIKTDGTLWAWGFNNYGQLGQNYTSATVYYSSPIQVGALTNWKTVAAGTYNILAISSPDLP